MSKESNNILYFQDAFTKEDENAESKLEETAAEAFCELANAPIIGFRVGSKRRKEIRIKQNSKCQTHTGGIVWETAYLLACYLEIKCKGDNSRLGKVLEVGSGCGMLGLALSASKLAKKVVMTETTEVLPNLEKNLAFNLKLRKIGGKEPDGEQHEHACCVPEKISVRSLRWDKFDKDIKKCQADGSNDLDPHSFDTIIGTDVIFSKTLVKPLLKTLRKMSHEGTRVYLCVQIRCADSHALLLKKASKYGLAVKDCTDELNDIPELKWGLALDCKLLYVRVLTDEDGEGRERSKKRRREG
jgi:predicted nicotinamide N-methyase